ncbi:MAG: hypothetical protein V4463_19960 [Pseudomonadota bacterium]
MPCFEVVLSGTGIADGVGLDTDALRGFIARRRVRAGDHDEAIALAREAVLADWRAGGVDGRSHVRDGPTVTVQSWRRLGWLTAVLGRTPSGYTLFRL